MALECRVSLLGHKDHGKSTLIGRLMLETGAMTPDRVSEARSICASMGKEFEPAFLLDSFVEEREGGFTLDSTVAQLSHGGTIYKLVDVPGHKELVRNMLTGASQADAGILILSAREDEGLQEETRLHLFLAGMLGMRAPVLAINKMDAVGYDAARFRSLASDASALIRAFGMEPAAAVPISAMGGDNVMSRSANMPWYGGKPLVAAMAEAALAAAGNRLSSLPARMIVQDSYELGGAGMLVGKVDSGSFRKGQRVAVEPDGLAAAVEDIIGTSGASVGEVHAGQNAGIALAGGARAVRGSVCMCAERPARAAKRVEARAFCFPGGSLCEGDRVRVICSSQEADAGISRIMRRMDPAKESAFSDSPGTEVGQFEAADLEITLERPLVLEKFADVPPTGRFMIEKGGRVAGIGIVL